MYIAQKNFDLMDQTEAIKFQREMYNFGDEIAITLDNLDDDKKDKLAIAKEIAKGLSSLATAKNLQSKAKTPTPGTAKKGTLHSVSEESEEPLYAHDVQSYIKRMGYNFFLPFTDVRVFIYRYAID